MGLKESFDNLNKRFGTGTVMKMGDKPQNANRFSSGSLKFDIALGGGLAKGKIIEIFSPDEAVGKTAVALSAIREIQSLGGTAAFIDAEHALNPEYAEMLGVKVSDLIISQPSCGEDAFEIARELIRSGEVHIIVFDSVSALIPKAELAGESGESKIGLQARMMSQAMRQITGISSNSECTLIFINQMREKIGVYYGDNHVTSGGNALKFYATQRIQITKSAIRDGTEVIGFTQKIRVVKNKIGVPFKKAERDIIYKTGVDVNQELLDVAIDNGIIEKRGSWFYYGEQKLGQGAAKALELMDDNEEFKLEIMEKVLEKIKVE